MSDTEIDKELVALIQQARKAPRNFVLIAKGTACLKLLLSKKPIRDGEVTKARKETGGNVVIRGVCSGDGADLVFQVIEQPAVSDAKLKAFVADTTGLTLKPRFQVVPTLQEVDEADGPVSDGGPPASPVLPASPVPPAPPPPPAPPLPPSSDASRAFAARLKAAKPALDQALSAGDARAQQLRTLSTAMSGHVRSQDFAAAQRTLDEIVQLLGETASGTPTTGDSQGNPSVEFNQRLRTLLPRVKSLSGTPAGDQARTRTAEAGELAKKQNFEQAHRVLDEVETLLNAPVTATEGTGGASGRGFSIVKLGQARLEWRDVRRDALAELDLVKEAIIEAYEGEPKKQGEVREAIRRLDSLFVTLDESLYAELDDVLNAPTPTERQTKIAVAKATVKRFLDFTLTNPIMTTVDDNRFVKDTRVAGPIRAKLNEIAAALG